MAQTADKTHRAFIEDALAKRGMGPGPGSTVYAELNHDRWVASCPCNGAEIVAPGLPMLCGSCGAEHEVVFPSPKRRKQVEAAIKARPPYLRNWKVGESVDDLIAQNIDNGIFPEDY